MRYQPGRYIEVRGTGRTRVRLRLTVQPLARFTHVSVLPDNSVNWLIRRARMGFLVRLTRQLGLKSEIQIKNMNFGLSNMYGIWQPNRHVELQAGFIKAPGGLERDTYSFNEPFIERSVLAFLTIDHEMGVKIGDDDRDDAGFWAVSLTRLAPFGVDGGDPEDRPVFPPGVEPEDVTQSPSKFNTAARVGYAPSDAFEVSVNGGARFRTEEEEPDFGDRVAEPYDSAFVEPRPWFGVMIHAGADVALSQPHWRLMAEGGFRRDGRQLAVDFTTGAQTRLDGHLNAELGYVVFGWTPDGHYAPARDNFFLEDGWEIVTRVEGARVEPVDIPDPITMVGVTAGAHFEVSPQLRLQADFGFQHYSSNAEASNTASAGDSTSERYIGQLWATWRL